VLFRSIFAKIALDKIVHVIEFYFGQGRGIRLNSHDDLTKGITKFASLKGLSLPEVYVALSEHLKKDVSDFRDYQIEHEKSPRTTRCHAESCVTAHFRKAMKLLLDWV